MNLHAKDKTQHPENVELLSAQKPITDFKGLLTTIISAVVCFGIYHILPYSPDANKGIALLIFVAALWFTEAVHITITALMVPILAVVLGFPDMDIKKAMADFSNPIIYIFFGGFALATALHMQRLDRKIAVSLLRLSRGNMKVAVLMLFLVTAFLSMWISNTATAAMMLPLAMGMLSHLDREKEHKTYVFLLLGIAYCASIGGLGTLVGSPPNLIAAKALNLDFVGWMKLGLPMMLLILPLMLLSLYVILKPNLNERVEIKAESIPWTLHRVIALLIFLATAAAWIFGSKIKTAFGISNPDTVRYRPECRRRRRRLRRGAMEGSRPQYRLGRVDALRRRHQPEHAVENIRRVRSLGTAGCRHLFRRARIFGDTHRRRLHYFSDRVHQQHRLRRPACTDFLRHRYADGAARTSLGIRHRHRRILRLHAAGCHAA